MKLPLLFLSLVMASCTPTTYIVPVDPPPCKAVCVQEYSACIEGAAVIQLVVMQEKVAACYDKEKNCFDICDKDEIR